MSKKIIHITILVVVLGAAWFLLDKYTSWHRYGEVSQPAESPYISPAPTQTPQTLEQELDASLQGDIESEFKIIDEDANNL